MAAADVAKGATVFKKCAACHKPDGAHAVGPHLNGVVGRPVGSVEGFSYSDADQGTRRRLDAGGDLQLPRRPEEGHPRHQDELRGPAQARGPRERDRLPRVRCSSAPRPITKRSGPETWPQAALPPGAVSVSAATDATDTGPPHGPIPRPAPSRSLAPATGWRPCWRRLLVIAALLLFVRAGRGPGREPRRHHHQPRPLDLRRSQVSDRLPALRLRQSRRPKGRHLPHLVPRQLRLAHPLHREGRRRRERLDRLRQPDGRLARQPRPDVRADRRERDLPAGQAVGQLQDAPRGALLRRQPTHRRGRRSSPST